MMQTTRYLKVLVATVLIGAPLLGGSSHPPITLLVAALGALAFAVALVDRRDETLELTPIAVVFFAFALVTLLQLVPISPSLAHLLDPAGEATRRLALAGLAPQATWRPITSDLGGTLSEAARLLGLALFAIALGRLSSPRYRSWLRAVLCVSLASTIVLAGLGALGVPLPQFLVPHSTHRSPVAFPFVNPNHEAAFIAALLPTVWIVMTRTEGNWKIAVGAIAFAANAALFATLSRAGIAIGAAAQLLTILILVRSQETLRARRLSVVVCTSLSVGMLAVAAPLFAKVSTLSSAGIRLAAWHDCLRLIADHWRVGVGRGAFALVFAGYNQVAGATRFAFLENEYLQSVADYGVFLVVIVGAVFVWFVALGIRRFRNTPSVTTRATLIGLGALAIHNSLDFSWEISGVTVICCALGALGVSSRHVLPRALAFAAGGLFVVVFGLALSSLGRTAEQDGNRLKAHLQDEAVATDELERQATAAFRHHPFDSFIPDVAAARLLDDRDRRAFDWLDRAMLVSPHDPLTHRLTARGLVMAGANDQGALELRRSFEEDREPFGPVWFEIDRLFGIRDDAVHVAAAMPRRADIVLPALGLLSAQHRWKLVEAVARVGVELNERDIVSLRALVQALLARHDEKDAADVARRLVAIDHSSPSLLLAANALSVAGDLDGAERILTPYAGDDPAVAIALSDVLMQREQLERARQLLDDALARAVDAQQKVEVLNALARVDDRSGLIHRAAADRAEAARLNGQ